MADTDWAFPASLQPQPAELRFDLQAALRSIVLVHAEVPAEAFTADALGTERIGHGILIEPGPLVLTIGYLITEAQTIWLTTASGAVVPGHALGQDPASGLGLVMPLGRLDAPALARGTSARLAVGDCVYVAVHGGIEHTLKARLAARREFAGYWEYLLEEALFTTPAHPRWTGAALLGEDGLLLGVGSLLVQENEGSDSFDANMFVPVELLEPILDELTRLGRPARPARPWLGMYATPMKGQLVVGGLTQGGPAQRAGVQLGDVVVEVAGEPVAGLADLLRRVWSRGPAGTQIPLTLRRDEGTAHVKITSADRDTFLLKPRRH
jgi:S1-C subfamily serine protease